MFDKDTYKKNREAGLRGQGNYPTLIVGIESTPPTSSRGLGLRTRVHATKHSIFDTESWAARKAKKRKEVLARELVATTKAAERRESRKAVVS